MLKLFDRILVAACVLTVLHACTLVPGKPVGERGKAQPKTAAQVSPAIQQSYEQALALMKSEQYPKAVEAFKHIIDIDPTLAAAHVNLGIAYSKLGRDDEAQRALSKALSLDPRQPAAHNALGILQRQRGRFHAARKSYEAALARHPNYLYAHLNLGILCDLYLQNMACALQHYERYLELKGREDKQVALWIADLKKRRSALAKRP